MTSLEEKICLIESTVGHTPLQDVSFEEERFFLKREDKNGLTHTLKDRTAWGVIKHHLKEVLDEEKIVIDTSSGNFACAMATLGKYLGFPFHLVADPQRFRNASVGEKLESLGAHIERSRSPRLLIEKLLQDAPHRYFWTDQYSNQENQIAHEETGREMVQAFKEMGIHPDVFLTGLGTTGSSKGIGGVLRHAFPEIKIVGIVAAPGMFIQGIRTRAELTDVALFNEEFYDLILDVHPEQAKEGQEQLHRLDIPAGISTGAAFYAARCLRQEGFKYPVLLVCSRDPASPQKGKS